jgi:hypothetical protein
VDKIPDKPNFIRLDVYELKNYKPVVNYRINVSDKIILSVDNNDIPPRGATKCFNEPIKEYLEITPLTPIENLDYGSQLTHRFQIKKLGWKNLFLNLTDNDLIKLGFKEKPKRLRVKLNETQRWFIGICVIIAIAIGNWYFDFLPTKEKSYKRSDMPQSQERRKTPVQDTLLESNRVDSTNILKTDSLTKKLK